jgi:hypothetical protein
MRRLSVLAVCLFVLGSVSAQKFKKGSIDFLKDQNKVNLVFDFAKMTVNGDSEENYIKERMADEKTSKEADQWKNEWLGSHRTQFTNTFTKYCNDELKKLQVSKAYKDATYTIIVKIEDIDPGNFAGPFSNPAKLRATFKVVKTSDMNTVLAELFLKKIFNPASAFQPIEYMRIDMGFGELGKELAKQLNKSLKKK